MYNTNTIDTDKYVIAIFQMNPQHTIPVLNDNGTIVVDSHAIGAYLSEKYGKNDSLYPKDLGKRALVDARLHFDSLFLFGRIRTLFEPVLYDKCPELSADKIEFIQRSWPLMEAFLQDTPYVCGNDLTIADLCCIASVSSIDTIAPIDAAKFPKFNAWIDRMKNLPYYDELNAFGAKQVQETIIGRVKENKALAEKQ